MNDFPIDAEQMKKELQKKLNRGIKLLITLGFLLFAFILFTGFLIGQQVWTKPQGRLCIAVAIYVSLAILFILIYGKLVPLSKRIEELEKH